MYVLHPGYVRSRWDGQMHYVGLRDLVRLYRLKPGTYMAFDDRPGCRPPADATHLYPRWSGDYSLPERP